MTLSGPELLFTASAVFAVCGAPMMVTIDGEEKPMWSRLVIQAGQKLRIGKVADGGCRSYLAIKGVFQRCMIAYVQLVLKVLLITLVPCIWVRKLELLVFCSVVRR